jgi:DNA-directed RNA polymerase specialized sigma subunit
MQEQMLLQIIIEDRCNGDKIKFEFSTKGHSQKEISSMLHISHSTVSRDIFY